MTNNDRISELKKTIETARRQIDELEQTPVVVGGIYESIFCRYVLHQCDDTYRLVNIISGKTWAGAQNFDELRNEINCRLTYLGRHGDLYQRKTQGE